MGLPHSTFYDPAPTTLDAGEILTRIGAIRDEFECYGYRRVGAALRHQGIVVNGKKLRRLMREPHRHPGWHHRNARLVCFGTDGWFRSESVAGFVGIRTHANRALPPVRSPGTISDFVWPGGIAQEAP